MKRSIHFTGTNLDQLNEMVTDKTARIPDGKHNLNKFANSIFKQHFNSVESQMMRMSPGTQLSLSEVDYDTAMSMINTLKRSNRGEWLSVPMNKGFMIKRLR